VLLPFAFLAACSFDVPVTPPAPTAPPREVAPPPPTIVSPIVQTPPVDPLPPTAHLQDEANSIQIFKAAAPATVFVTQSQLVLDRWRGRREEVPAGAGTGFVWDQQGHIVTNYHVVDGAQSLSVTLWDQTEWPARLVGGDPRKDVAVLRIEAPRERLVAIRRAPQGYELAVGQKTAAIGNPFGLDHTLTVGIISALDREVMGYGDVTIRGMIQTDASINPGNSGGPLLDSQGQLIGMNTMIYSESGSSAGIGFAVPWTTIDRVVSQILTRGRVQELGIGVALVDPRLTRRQGIEGLVISDVVRGGPAEQAGLRGVQRGQRGWIVGDVIVAIDDQPIRSYDDLYNHFDARGPGDVVQVKLRRGGAEQVVPMALVDVSSER
jgi:S1-C subfamily serine protease